MLTLLNLLPTEKKAALQRQVRSRFLLWQVVLLLFLEIFYTSVLVGAYVVLSSQKEALVKSYAQYASASTSQEGILDMYEGKFRGTNEAIEVIGRIEREHVRFDRIFLFLEEVLPDGVTINRLSAENFTVMLTGRAETRESLLLLNERLKGSACLQELNMPISNLFSQTEVDFQLDFTLKPHCLSTAL